MSGLGLCVHGYGRFRAYPALPYTRCADHNVSNTVRFLRVPCATWYKV